MENLSSSELDSPSKTPLFIAIAAVIVALVSLGIGWMGLSRATAMEKEVARLSAGAGETEGLKSTIQDNAQRLEKLTTSVNSFSKNVNDALTEVSGDMSKIRSEVRKNTITSAEAKKMVEDLEQKGVKVSVVPVASSSSAKPASGTAVAVADAPVGKAGIYTIKSGDTLGKIAAEYKITLDQLQKANPDIDPRRMRIGQQINVPGAGN